MERLLKVYHRFQFVNHNLLNETSNFFYKLDTILTLVPSSAVVCFLDGIIVTEDRMSSIFISFTGKNLRLKPLRGLKMKKENPG